ncbi:MAG: sigma-54-dependent Fis family transcriptional regulator [Bdellovibrionaceae bacterium]|nr:sigma-54-dependent Fis family transcriptional regulator [Pseudobdellovibrionaceae bacterium]
MMMNWVDYGRFQTQSECVVSLLKSCEKLALTMGALFIYGEEGSGRRSLARWVHDHSQSRGRFLVWSAHDFDAAALREGDTVLIENIHEFEPADLIKLKRHLEASGLERSSRVRFVVTSSLSPNDWIESSSLARELAYRLCVVTLKMPSLRDRHQDIIGLAHMFLRVACLVNGLPDKKFSNEALALLQTREWSGNVAELNNVVERSALKSDSSTVNETDLTFLSRSRTQEELNVGQSGITLFEMEKKLIFQTLEMTRQNKTRAAQILGISIRTLRNKLNSYREAEVS